jgi:hypothetical protein
MESKMGVRFQKRIGLLVLAVVLFLAGGCIARSGRVRTESQMVELGGATSVRVRIEMGAGELSVDGNANTLMDAGFTYNVARWRPEVTYEVDGDQGELVIRQPRVANVRLLENYRYEWDIRLSEGVPIDLSVALGAGESRLNVADLALTALSVEMGAGDSLVDLSGDREDDLEVSIQGGVGRLTVMLPEDVGARVQVVGGLGSVNAPGLQVEGDAYVNDAYGRSEATIQIDIEGGIGEVDLELVR